MSSGVSPFILLLTGKEGVIQWARTPVSASSESKRHTLVYQNAYRSIPYYTYIRQVRRKVQVQVMVDYAVQGDKDYRRLKIVGSIVIRCSGSSTLRPNTPHGIHKTNTRDDNDTSNDAIDKDPSSSSTRGRGSLKREREVNHLSSLCMGGGELYTCEPAEFKDV